MGISGLLPLLKSIMLPVHIKDLKGCSVAIDTYSWLHKGALSCSKDLCKGLPTSKPAVYDNLRIPYCIVYLYKGFFDRHIDYCMHRVNMLRHYGVKPILVFDGGLLPMKSDQENKRARSRKENLSRAMEHESNGNSTAAYECFQKAVDISPSIAYDLIQVLRWENISYIVAPYEADAQMTYLAVSKQVDAIITEDSDLIAFGCPRIIYKMDKFGQGVEFDASMLEQNRDLIFTGFTKQMFLEMCILSGCDYLQSLPGMGLKKAHALIKKFKSYDKVLKHLKYSSMVVSPLYEESFKKAILTFRHQRVYDPVSEETVHLFELPNGLDGDLDFLGPSISQDVAKGIAKGDLDPLTKVPFKGECSGGELVEIKSNQLKNFKFDSAKKKLELPAQKNLLTNYFCFASLEAKREYKAPRVSPTIQKTDHGVLNAMRYAYVQSGSVRELSSTSAVTGLVLSRAESEAEVESQTNGLNEVASNEVGTPNKMLQDPIYRPCTALRKKHNSNPDPSKVRPERINTTLRSSYFLHATTNELNEIQEKNNICTDADFGSARYAMRPVSVDSDRKISTSIKKVVVSSYFQGKTVQGKIQYGKNENQLDEAPCNNLAHLDETKSMSTTDEDNATGRNHQGPEILVDKQEKFAVKDGKTVDLDKYAFSRPPSSNNYLEEARKRRKVASIDNPEIENSGGNEFSTGSDTACETKTGEEKFGCNISHIGQYSEIAEKSLERFASVVSSFKFTSNGSRASGLRPPLKDVKNTCNNRLSGSTDLSKFAYAPTKKAPTSRGM